MKKSEEQVVKNIIKIRENNGLSKRKLANELGINEASYGRIESGEIALSYDHLAKIANFYQMSVIDIITYPDVYVKKEEATPSKRTDEYYKKRPCAELVGIATEILEGYIIENTLR